MSDSQNIILIILNSIPALCSIVSLLITILTASRNEKTLSIRANRIPTDDINSDGEEKTQRRLLLEAMPFFLILSMTLLSSVLLLYGYISPERRVGTGEKIAFGVSIVCFAAYVVMARKSFDNYYILPPQWLWQSLFNKIPSHIHHANQLEFKFLVLKMDDSDEVNNAGDRIKNNYLGRKDFQVEVKPAQDIDKTIDTKDYCGVIFLVSNASNLESVQRIMDEYSKKLVLPIAYVRLGTDHIRLSKYDRISEKYLDKYCANHLVMRSYRRSEYWVRLSRNSTSLIWIVLGLAFVLLLAYAKAERRIFHQEKIITEKEDSLCMKKVQSGVFAEDRDKFHVDNDLAVSLHEVDFEITVLQEDVNFQNFVKGFAMYSFDEINHDKHKIKNIKIWLRNNKQGDTLYCIYADQGDVKSNDPKEKTSMIGGIAENPNIFVLWPGYNNNDSIWDDSSQNTMAWDNEDHGEFTTCKLIKRNKKYNVGLELQKDKKEITLNWIPKDNSNSNSNSSALYGFSYDGRLAVEIDLKVEMLRDKDIRTYIQNLQFRNCVRRFTTCINSFLNYYYDERITIEKLEKTIDSMKNVNNVTNIKH